MKKSSLGWGKVIGLEILASMLSRDLPIQTEYLLFNWHSVLYIKPAIFLNGNVDYCINPDMFLFKMDI